MSLQPTYTLKDHRDRVRVIVEVGSDNLIVTGSADQTVKVWSSTESRCLKTFVDNGGEVYDAAVIDDSTVLTVGGNIVQIFNVSTGRVVAKSAPFPNELRSCAVLNKSTGIVGDMRGTLFKFEWRQGWIKIVKVKRKMHTRGISRIVTRKNEVPPISFATFSSDNTVKLWDTASLSVLHSFTSHEQYALSVAYDDTFFVTGSRDATIQVYDIITAAHLTTISTHTEIVRFLHIVQGRNILISGSNDSIVSLHILPAGTCIGKFDFGMKASAFSLLRNGMIAIAGITPYYVKLFEINELQQLLTRSVNDEPVEAEPVQPEEPNGHVKYTMSSDLDVEESSAISRATHMRHYDLETMSTISHAARAKNQMERITERERESAVRYQFKAFAIGKGKSQLTIAESSAALNIILTILGVDKGVSEDEFEAMFMNLSEELTVSEHSFVQVFHAIMTNGGTVDGDYLARVYADKFDQTNIGRSAIGLQYATRILRHACRELNERGFINDATMENVDVSVRMMANFDDDRDGKVNRDQFIAAALSIVHGIGRN